MKKTVNIKKSDIENEAFCFLNKYKDFIVDESFVDVSKIAKSLGFTVCKAKLNYNESGFLIIDNAKNKLFGIKANKLIVINQNCDFHLKRFIIAYLLGYYWLEYENNNKTFIYREYKADNIKTQNKIEYFASCLLMPSENFIKKYNEYKKDCFDNDLLTFFLAKQFGVTYEVCRRRLKDFHLYI